MTVAAILAGCGTQQPVQNSPSAAAGSGSPVSSTSAPATPVEAQPLPEGDVVAGLDSELLGATSGIWVFRDEFAFETADTVAIFDIGSRQVVATVPLPEVEQINGVSVSEDSVWVLDHDAGRVVRVDRSTGEEVAAIDIGGRAVSLLQSPHGIWAGSARVLPEYVSLIDPASNEIVRTVELGAFPKYADGHLWFGRDETGGDFTVRKVDPESGSIVESIDLDGAEGCYVDGEFPDVVWSWCFEPPPDPETVATRLDVSGMAVSATVPLGGAGGLVGVTQKHSWFFADRDGEIVLLRLSNDTNAVDAAFGIGPTDPYAIADGFLWVIDRAQGELRVIPLPSN